MALKPKDAKVEIEQKKEPKKTGRPPGVPNKVSPVRLLNALTDENFNLIGEMIDFYRKEKNIYDQLYEQASDADRRSDMNDTDVKLFDIAAKEISKMQIKMASHCFATIKAIEIDTGTGDKTIFNISIPAPDKTAKPLTDSLGNKSDHMITMKSKDGNVSFAPDKI